MKATRPSQTAEVVAFMRAAEGWRGEGRILDDPYAKAFLGPLLRTRLAAFRAGAKIGVFPPALSTLSTYIVARHRYMDEALEKALQTPVEQVLILGAGYDMRAWRFSKKLNGRPIFEVDHPATAARKGARLQRLGDAPGGLDRRVVTIDFQTESLTDRLIAAGFKPGRSTFVTWEGVSMYLQRDAVKYTLSTLRDLCGSGSTLTMDFWQLLDGHDLHSTWHRVSGAFLWAIGEPISFASHPEDVTDLLAREGWKVEDIATPDVLKARYVRDGRVVYPANFVVTASRA